MRTLWLFVVVLALGWLRGTTAATSPDDVLTLLKVKASLGPNSMLANWTLDGDPCSDNWYGIVACTTGTTQRVANLQLQNINLNGTISPFIGNLSALTWLDMSSNRLSGDIPSSFANLVNITRINLHSNLLTGTLRPFINLQKMNYLNVGTNLISGTIPPEFNNLTTLTYFSIGGNPISGTIPDLSNLVNIIHIHFDNMNLTGPLPPELSKLTNMIHLVVQNNKLSGPLPASLSALSSILLIQLDNNSFTGPLPPSYSNLSTLLDFRAVNTQLSGSIDPSWLQLTKLRKLDLSYNQFSGELPPGIGEMPNLIDLNLEHNNFSGAVPSSLCSSLRMTTLRLNDNRFSGALPPSCLNLTSPPFQSAFFHDNSLTGPIPSNLDSPVGITVFGNPWCAGNAQLPACKAPPSTAVAPAPVSISASPPPSSSPLLPTGCSCPSGQVPQPYTPSVQLLSNGSVPCSCVYPSQFVINLPGVSYVDLTPDRLQRLALSLAATLNLLPQQVIPEGACPAKDPYCGVICTSPVCSEPNSIVQVVPSPQCLASADANCTSACKFPPCVGTTAAFQLLPVAGQQIPPSYIEALESRLTIQGNNSWFSNKIEDEFVPYTLIIAQPATTIVFVKGKTSTGTIVAAVVGAVVGVLILLALIAAVGLGIWWYRRRTQKFAAAPWLRQRTVMGEASQPGRPSRGGSGVPLMKEPSGSSSGWKADTRMSSAPSSAAKEPFLNTQLRTYSFQELAAATGNFSKDRAVGSGGFGTVYRATLPDDSEVAVKRLSLESRQGEPEFLAEIGSISQRLDHPNLLQLLGYCAHGKDRLLVYELMRRGDLRSYLRDGRKNPQACLDWETRLNIACDSTAGLQYLHEGFKPPVVHRDIKTSNILLDDNFRAKISDFGLAKLYPEDDATHITTKVQGTYGYLAPDYATTGLLTTKSDVYSMGVVFLELFSGVVAVSASSLNSDASSFLVPWARRNSNKVGFWKEVMDPALDGECPLKAAKLFAALAVGMTATEPDERPSMSQVGYTLQLIKNETAAAPPPLKGQSSLSRPKNLPPFAASSDGDVSTTSTRSGNASNRKRGDPYRPFEPPSVSGDGFLDGQSSAGGSSGPWVQLSESGSQAGSHVGAMPEHSTLWKNGPSLITEVRPEAFQGAGR